MKVKLQQVKDWFRESQYLLQESRDSAKLALEYYSDDQLSEEVKQELSERRQPEFHENIIAEIMDRLSGYEIVGRTDINFEGRQFDDVKKAKMMGQITKAIMDMNRYDVKRSRWRMSVALTGLAVYHFRVDTSTDEYDKNGNPMKDVKIDFVDSFEIDPDPYSRKDDYSDAKYIHRSVWTDKSEIATIFPDFNIDELVAGNIPSPLYDTFGNYYNTTQYNASNRDRHLLVESWYNNGGKTYVMFWSGDSILMHIESPYGFKGMDDHGFPFVVKRFEYSVNKPKYAGLFPRIKPMQDRINFAHLRIQNMMGGGKVYAEENAVTDWDQFLKDVSRDNAVVKVKPGALQKRRVEVKEHRADIATHYSMVGDFRTRSREVVGMNNEFAGSHTNARTGEAIKSRQDAARVGIQKLLDVFRDGDVLVGRKMLKFIQKFYDQQRSFRILTEDLQKEFIEVNQPSKDFEMVDGYLLPVVSNDLQIGKYDVVVVEDTHSETAREQTITALTEVFKTAIASNAVDAQEVRTILAAIIQNTNVPNREELAAKFLGRLTQKGNNSEENEQQQLQGPNG